MKFVTAFCTFWIVLLAVWMAPFAAASPPSAVHALRTISADNPDYVYAGRVDFSDRRAPVFYWAGNSATIGFTGRDLGVVLVDPQGGVYFDVIIDGDGEHRQVIRCRKGRHVYPLATHLADTRHMVEVFRRVDPTLPGVSFAGIRIDRNAIVFRPKLHHALRIAFYGDSITSGYGVLDPDRKDEGSLSFMDNYVAYGAVAARALHADYRSISLSGIGIMKSWFPLVMPQMYDRLAPRDPESRWNFAQWQPDIVVVNLLQNDSWLLPHQKHPPSGPQVVHAYAGFVRELRGHYPHAAIICMLGNMDVTAEDSPWPGYVDAAVQSMRARGDRRIHSLIVPFKRTPGHPNVQEQRTLAQALMDKIKSIEASGG